MRKTKIVCTIGPASDSKETLEGLCLAGMNVARLNFSHGTHEEHQIRIDTIKEVRKKLELPIAIMLDTKGPEYRIKTFKDSKITLSDGDTFIFTTEDVIGDERRVSVSYSRLPEEISVNDTILLNNGLFFYRKIVKECRRYLKENGKVLFEIGHDQGQAVSEMLTYAGFSDVKVVKDLAGNDRVVIGGL